MDYMRWWCWYFWFNIVENSITKLKVKDGLSYNVWLHLVHNIPPSFSSAYESSVADLPIEHVAILISPNKLDSNSFTL